MPEITKESTAAEAAAPRMVWSGMCSILPSISVWMARRIFIGTT
jgi:hypothetical protein